MDEKTLLALMDGSHEVDRVMNELERRGAAWEPGTILRLVIMDHSGFGHRDLLEAVRQHDVPLLVDVMPPLILHPANERLKKLPRELVLQDFNSYRPERPEWKWTKRPRATSKKIQQQQRIARRITRKHRKS